VEIFPEITDAERAEHGKLIARAAAQMGRHFAKFAVPAAALLDRLDAAERENELLLNKLNSLLMLVSKKYPGETRYETACRYIREAEKREELTRATKENK